MISSSEVATPPNTENRVKPAIAARNTSFRPNRVLSQPEQAVTMVLPMRNEVPSQAIWSGAAEKVPCR